MQYHNLALPPCPQIYAAPLAGGARAVVLFNAGPLEAGAASMTVRWEQLGLPNGTKAAVRDLYAEKDLGEHTGSFTAAAVAAHDVAALRITPLGGAGTAAAGDSWRPWHQLHGPLHPARPRRLQRRLKAAAIGLAAAIATGLAVTLAAARLRRRGEWRRLDRSGSGVQGGLQMP